MKKQYLLNLIIFFITFGIFAQNIDLPDITTVIDNDTVEADINSLPDFNDVLEKTEGSGAIVPKLPDMNIDKVPESMSGKTEEVVKKPIFSEVLLGGGYPSFFRGDCSVFGVDQLSPFKISFKFNAANGYNGHSLTDNYSDRNINLYFEKEYTKNEFNWNFSTEYNSVSNGLQGNADGMSIVNQDVIQGKGAVVYNFSNGFCTGINLDLNLYNRYGNISNRPESPVWTEKSFIFGVGPEIFGNWSGNGFDIGLSCAYLGDFNFDKNISGGNNHRGDVTAKLQWSGEYVCAFGNVSLIFGNHLNSSSILVPFTIGTDFTFPVYFSNRMVCISAEGGLKSQANSVKNLENKYKFTALAESPTESSFWYGKVDFDIPIKSSFTANASAEYRYTAFENGSWEPVYEDNNFYNGLYKINKKDLQQLLITDFGVTYHHKLFSIKAGLYSNWFDVPEMEGMHMISLNTGFQDKKSKWGANLFGLYSIDENWTLPIINLDCFVQLSPTIRLTAAVNDIIPLFDTRTRMYAGKYTDRGFMASLFLNFVL